MIVKQTLNLDEIFSNSDVKVSGSDIPLSNEPTKLLNYTTLGTELLLRLGGGVGYREDLVLNWGWVVGFMAHEACRETDE